MNWAEDCAAVIPCLNEAATIGGLVQAVQRHLPAVIVVDDGSSDSTASLAMAAGAEVVRHLAPQGKGAALARGWSRARERGFKWALTLDGDGQHSPSDIPVFLNCAAETSARLIIGNRMANPRGMPWVRRHVNRWMSRRISRLAGADLPDSQCGFRLMDLETWAGLPVSAAHFEIESDVLLAFVQAGLPIQFVPVQSIYKSEQSKIHPWHDTVRWFRWWRSRSRP